MTGDSGTTIKLGLDAKASLAKKMKGKNYDLEGVDSHSSKRTHRTNMTRKTGMTSTRSVTTKKLAMDFNQNKSKTKKDCAFGTASIGDGIHSSCQDHPQTPVF